MKKFIAIFLATTLLTLMLATSVFAVEFKVGKDLFIDPPNKINDDIYGAGENVNISQDIEGDLIIAGGNVSIEEGVHISGDVIIAGGKVTINGNVGDDLRIVGGQVEINGTVNDDLLIFGGYGVVNKYVGGDVVLAGGMFELKGNVGGSIKGKAGKVIIAGSVEKDVNLTVTSKITLTDNSLIKGTLNYRAPLEIDINKKNVRGEIAYEKYELKAPLSLDEVKRWMTYSYIKYKFFVFLAYVLLALVLVLTMPYFGVTAAAHVKKSFWKVLGVGALTFVALIAGTFIGLVSGVGVFVGILIGAVGVIFYLISQVLVGIIIGSWIIKVDKKPSKGRLFGAYVLGFVIYSLLAIIPIVGWMIAAVAYLVAVGALVSAKTDMWKALRAKKLV